MDRAQEVEDHEQNHVGLDRREQCDIGPKEYLANLVDAEDAHDRSRDLEASHASTTAAAFDYLHLVDLAEDLVLVCLQIWQL